MQRINGFTLGGTPVPTPGLNGMPGAAGSYGLYFTMDVIYQNIGDVIFKNIGGVPTYLSNNVKLMADPGNNDGSLSATTSGVAFSNTGPTGTADDIVLATGSLASGTASFNPVTGTRSAYLLDTLAADPGEAGFFVTPLSVFNLLETSLTTPSSAFTSVPNPNGRVYSLVNKGQAVIDILVPERTTLAVLGSAAGGLALARQRRALRASSAPAA